MQERGDVETDRLTDKQKRFVDEYLVDLNATQAAIRAGYSEKRASEMGYQLLQKTTVSHAIEVAMKKREERTEITQDMVLRQLARVAFSDLKTVVEWDEQGVRIKPSHEVDGTILSEISETWTDSGKKQHVKLNDRLRALEMLGKHLGMFKDKVEMTGENGSPLQVVFNIPRPKKNGDT